jgi:hypothetical protein
MPYYGPAVVTTTSGVIADPANTPASLNDCLPYQCGLDPSNQGARQWCAFWGRSGNQPCTSPECLPWIRQIAMPGCGDTPAPPPFQPTVTNYPKISTASAASRALSPQSILRPLPQIVPSPTPEKPQVMCGGFTGWVNGNPVMAVAALVGLYFMVKR